MADKTSKPQKTQKTQNTEKAQFEVVEGAPSQDGGPSGPFPGANGGTSGSGGDGSEKEEDGRDESVTHPSKLIRIASMVRNMLEEVRRAPLDDAGRRLLRSIHERSIHELEGVLSEDLKAELDEVVLPFTVETPSESELRIAQAQLVGWLEGLFHGIQATIFSQQMTMQQQLDEMRQRKALEQGRETRTGPYL